ncbi:hypothetical protein PIB30_048826 [Stylosanthes scabra]|uniref:Uncharacterized protein n=1 Tax=Stylosanthes scabra TaxID=79078 RepID=A0ABU6SGY6_9FABA|nr:hypothetical protein [Stylosanthes scabra]
MCEELRCYLMRRMAKHVRLLGNYTSKLAPVQQKRLDKLIRPSNRRTVEWACDAKVTFQVTRGTKTVAVDISKLTMCAWGGCN